MRRPPTRSPSTPNMGAARVPRNCAEPKRVSSSTEPVCTITYQPRMSVSISNAQEVRRSAGAWQARVRGARDLVMVRVVLTLERADLLVQVGRHALALEREAEGVVGARG